MTLILTQTRVTRVKPAIIFDIHRVLIQNSPSINLKANDNKTVKAIHFADMTNLFVICHLLKDNINFVSQSNIIKILSHKKKKK